MSSSSNPRQLAARILATTLSILLLVTGANLLFLLWKDNYNFYLGPLHLVAHGFFKPILMFVTAFVLSILTRRPSVPVHESGSPALKPQHLWLILATVGVLWFLATADINPLYDEWNYHGLSHDLGGWNKLGQLFVTTQISAWYRPLGFLSLWLDSRIYGDHLWGYHVQNILWHLANAYLAGVIALRLRLSSNIATWATILFACAAVTYEPIMWPSARFDLLAMAFTGVATVAAIDYLEQAGTWRLLVALICYTLAVLSKESGYAFPVLLVPIVLLLNQSWRAILNRIVILASSTFVVSTALLAIRWVVVGGLGGYPHAAGGGSPHLSYSSNTVQSILTKLFPVSILAVNQVFPMPGIVRVTLACFVLLLTASVFIGASTTPRQRWFALFAILSAAPVATLVSWLDLQAQHVRYVYMPALFIMVLIAAALHNARGRTTLLTAFAALSLAIGTYDASAYRLTYQRSTQLANRIADEISSDVGRDVDTSAKDHVSRPKEVRVINMPGEVNGVLFSQFELMYRFQRRLPDVNISFLETGSRTPQEVCDQRICYLWQAQPRDLQRLP